jgi:hypothetical protein
MFRTLGVLLFAMAALSSCLGDKDEVTVYSDTAITEVTLGTLNRYTYGTSSKTGNDTVVKSTLTGSNYRLTIDQIAHTIYNLDSLPMGTDIAHVVLSSLSTKNSGVVVLKSLISDSLQYVTTTDSIDFTQPRILRVYSSDGTAYRDYTMTLTVSTTTGTTFGWQKVAERNELKGWADKHLVACLDTVLLVNNGIVIVGNSIYDVMAMRIGDNGYVEHFYMGKDGKDWTNALGMRSDMLDDANSWSKLNKNGKPRLCTLTGATQHEIFALGDDGRLKVCTDGIGLEWRDELLDDDVQLLPTSDIAMTWWPYAPADSTDYVLLAGSCDADDTNATLWRKLSRYHQPGMVTEGQWVYMPVDFDNKHTLPKQDGLSIAYYNGVVLAVGSNMEMLQSRDQGISWKATTTYALPSALHGTRVAMAADTKDRLWLATDAGELWMGMLR